MLSEDIPGFFDRYGWRYERRDPTIYRTGFVGEAGAWDVWVRSSTSLVIFVISPFVARPADVTPGPFLLRALLKANHEMNLAKFAIDDDDDVSLAVELPAEGFGYAQFADALTALAHYADEFKERLEDAVRGDADDRVSGSLA